MNAHDRALRTPCTWCGKLHRKHPYNMNISQNIFCSLKCKSEHDKHHNPPFLMRFVCDHCGAEVEKIRNKAEKYNTHFCSKECYRLSRIRPMIGLTCHECGQHFTRRSSWVNRKLEHAYCSVQCSISYRAKKQRRASHEAIHYKREVEYCMVCGFDEDPILLAIHWLDGNSQDKSRENILVVCPTCREKIKMGLLKQYWSGK